MLTSQAKLTPRISVPIATPKISSRVLPTSVGSTVAARCPQTSVAGANQAPKITISGTRMAAARNRLPQYQKRPEKPATNVTALEGSAIANPVHQAHGFRLQAACFSEIQRIPLEFTPSLDFRCRRDVFPNRVFQVEFSE